MTEKSEQPIAKLSAQERIQNCLSEEEYTDIVTYMSPPQDIR